MTKPVAKASEAREGKSLFDLGGSMTLELLPIVALREQEVNANVMPPAVFRRLVENIKKRGALESVPYCARVNGRVEIVSGHHRVRAARTAGLTEIVCLVDSSPYTRSAIAAKQLAHNALAGSDDVGVRAQLLSMIDSPDDLLETGLDLGDLTRKDEIDVTIFAAQADFERQLLTFAFLPHQFDEFEDLNRILDRKPDLLGVAPPDLFRPFIEAAAKYARLKDVRAIGTVIALLIRTALEEVRRAEEEETASAK